MFEKKNYEKMLKINQYENEENLFSIKIIINYSDLSDEANGRNKLEFYPIIKEE